MDAASLDRLVEVSDWQAIDAALTEMSTNDAVYAGKWYRRSGRALARRVADRDWREHSRVVQLLLALALSETPEEASRNCQWGRRFIWRDDEMAAAACADRLIARGREWAAEFVRLATSTTFRGESRRGVGEVVSLTSAAIAAHNLDTPLTETYVLGWISLISWAHTHQKAENRAQWHPLALMTESSDAARPAYKLSETLTLGDCLAATRSVSALLVAALAAPNALHEWASFSEEGWEVESTIRDAIRAGTLERGPLLDHAFTALSRDDRANNQRVIGELLKGLDPAPDEIRERIALILHVLPTAHGSVTKMLLAMALAAALDDDDIVAIGTVILARPEKAQKSTLLAHVAKMDGDARDALLALASGSDDASLAVKAQALFHASEQPRTSSEAIPRAAALPAWSHPVEPFRPGLFEPYAANEAGLDQARSEEETWSRITTEAAFLDLVVRFAHSDLNRLRTVVADSPEPNRYSHVRTPYLLNQWVKTGNAHRSYHGTSTSYRYEGAGRDPVIEQHSFHLLPPAHILFTDRLIEETLPRLGPLTELLSTPSRSDGTLSIIALADRVRRAQAVGYGPYDLVQALLRLDPASPADAMLFDGLTLPPVDGGSKGRSWFPRRRAAPTVRDGVEVIRSWIASGGWSPRRVDFPTLEPQTSELTLPLPGWLDALDGTAGICGPTGTGDDPPRAWGSDDPGPWLGVCPRDVENLAARIASRSDQDSVFHAQSLPLVVWSAGPIGAAVHHHLARLLAHPRMDSRLLTAQHAATLARQGRLQPQLLSERSLALFRHGKLALARAAHGWAELAAMSSLSIVWPTWMATLDAACCAEKKPAGLADLLRTTREHVPAAMSEGDAGWLPPSVRRLADERGTSKAVVEARALLGAVQAGVM